VTGTDESERAEHSESSRGDIDTRCVDTIRFLAVDAVEAAHSGHPGAPLGASPMAYALWHYVLKHNPADPSWPDRDRFVLSAGHASAMLYALLHLTGYDVSLSDLRHFRQWGSKTPGHPERGDTPGVEMTTGPLGQGMAHAVGMAIAERHQAATFNRPGHEVVDHHTFALVSDGDLEEGVSAEAASLAGTLGLGKLICLYDDNGIQIEGDTDDVFREDVAARFKAYGWQVLGPVDGEDVAGINESILEAMADTGRPSLVICHTTIGYGSPRAGSPKAHGEPLGPENVRATKEALGWPLQPPFLVPDDVRDHMRSALTRGAEAQAAWTARWESYAADHPDLARQLEAQLQGLLTAGWDQDLEGLFDEADGPIATRAASGIALNALARRVPALMGGSADLAPSNKTWLEGEGLFSAEVPTGRNMRFGVREHAMGAILGGMALHGGFIPYGGTFLVFSDYMRPPMRLAALMGLRVIYVFTHDSIGVGEDGPTHQPIEQIMSLRSVPNLTVIRPADAYETARAWAVALANEDGPTALVLTRQKLPSLAPARRESAWPGESVLGETDQQRSAQGLIGGELESGKLSRGGQERGGLERGGPDRGGLERGAYVLWESPRASEPAPSGGDAEDVAAASAARMGQQAASGQADQSRREAIDVILIASGSEVHLALEAGRALSAEGIGVRVVSMPSWELFDAQGQEYRDAVLPPAVRARVAIEAGTPEGWEHYIGLDGAVIGMRTFGASAPGAELFEHFGFTVSAVMEKAREVLGR